MEFSVAIRQRDGFMPSDTESKLTERVRFLKGKRVDLLSDANNHRFSFKEGLMVLYWLIECSLSILPIYNVLRLDANKLCYIKYSHDTTKRFYNQDYQYQSRNKIRFSFACFRLVFAKLINAIIPGYFSTQNCIR